MVGSFQKCSVLDILHRSGFASEYQGSKNDRSKQAAEYKRYMYSPEECQRPDMASRMANQERHRGDTDDDSQGSG